MLLAVVDLAVQLEKQVVLLLQLLFLVMLVVLMLDSGLKKQNEYILDNVEEIIEDVTQLNIENIVKKIILQIIVSLI